ncbi:MAG: PQQ-binding-like beta-propeller repeat protein [Planctomycetaceae bacterium]
MLSKRSVRLAIILLLTICVTAIIVSALRWRGATPLRRVDVGHDGLGLAVLDDGSLVVAGTQQVTGWTATGQRRRFEIEVEEPIASIVAGQGGRCYVLDEEGGLLCFDDKGQTVAARAKNVSPIQCLAFRNGRLAAVSDQKLIWLDPITLRAAEPEPTLLSGPASVLDHCDGLVCVGNFLAEELQFLEGQDAWTVPIERVGAVEISTDGNWVAAVTWRGEVVLIDRVQRAIAWRKELTWTGEMRSVRFSPGGDHLVTCSPVRGRVWVLARETGESLLESAVGGDPVVVNFLTSGDVVALHADGDLRWWAVK